MKYDHHYVHPEEEGNTRYWARKWGVPQQKLHRAIIEIGTLRTSSLKQQLFAGSWLHHPFRKSMEAIRKSVSYVF